MKDYHLQIPGFSYSETFIYRPGAGVVKQLNTDHTHVSDVVKLNNIWECIYFWCETSYKMIYSAPVS